MQKHRDSKNCGTASNGKTNNGVEINNAASLVPLHSVI